MTEDAARPGVAAHEREVGDPALGERSDEAGICLRDLLGEQEFVGRDARPGARPWRPSGNGAVGQRDDRLEQVAAGDVIGRDKRRTIAGDRFARLAQDDGFEAHAGAKIVRVPHDRGGRGDFRGRERIQRM